MKKFTLPLKITLGDLYVNDGDDSIAVAIFTDKNDESFEIEFLLNENSSIVNQVFIGSRRASIPEKIVERAHELFDKYREEPEYDDAKEEAIKNALGYPNHNF